MNTNTIINGSLFDIVDGLDNAARIPALRSITHSAMAKCIGAIRQHIRDQARNIRNEDEPQVDLDQRNAFDENTRAEDEVKRAMGFSTQVPPLKQASLFHAVYDCADTDLRTLITSGAGERLTAADSAERVPQMEREIAELGRVGSERTTAINDLSRESDAAESAEVK